MPLIAATMRHFDARMPCARRSDAVFLFIFFTAMLPDDAPRCAAAIDVSPPMLRRHYCFFCRFSPDAIVAIVYV